MEKELKSSAFRIGMKRTAFRIAAGCGNLCAFRKFTRVSSAPLPIEGVHQPALEKSFPR